MYRLRILSVSQSRLLENIYLIFEPVIIKLHNLWDTIGYERVEKPVKVVEKAVKGFMFDCKMCGQCMLSSSGMSCPMNCPKSIRNGPCGGVRMNGMCEVEPDMHCVWVEAWRGSRQMKEAEKIKEIQHPLNHSYRETSSWLRVVRDDRTKKINWLPDVRIKR